LFTYEAVLNLFEPVDKPTLQSWYSSFLVTTAPTGTISKAYLRQTFKAYFPFGDSVAFADIMFHHMDTEKKGQLGFKEFITALSITSRGKIEDRIKCKQQIQTNSL